MTEKFILDVCCGARFFWFDKSHKNVVFQDKRRRHKGFMKRRPNREINPDVLMDFRKLKYKDKSFKLVIMDPPHLISKGEDFDLVRSYGFLKKESWKKDIKEGFDEALRVLEDYGVLVFKWNEAHIKRKELLKVLNKDPLIGHTIYNKNKTHWFIFMKIPIKEKSGGLGGLFD